MPDTTRTILFDAYEEIGIVGVGQDMSAEQAASALSRLNRLFDNWNAERCAVYHDQFLSFTLADGQQTRTIGPTGNFVTSQRPVSIEGANVVLTDVTPNVRTPITVHKNASWWQSLSVPEVESQFPTDLYYETGWPNGTIYLWPIPTMAYGIEMQVRMILASVGLDDEFNLPPGYRDAITLTLAEKLAGPNGFQVSQDLKDSARDARARIFDVNSVTPPIQADRIPSGNGGNRSNFNYKTGLPFS